MLHELATYVALEQCAGGEVIEGANQNDWWVRIEVPLGGEVITGWVSVVRIQGGGNDQHIDGVLPTPTRFEATASTTTTVGG